MSSERTLILLALLEGGLVMLLELCIPHVVAPVLGNSVNTWGLLIALSAGALALGYFLGAYLSKIEQKALQITRIFISAFFSLFIAYLLIKLQNQYALTTNESHISYLIIALGLFVPIVFFGASTPLIIAQLEGTGRTAGIIYSYSTWGGVFFTLLTGYVLIPKFGLMSAISLALYLLMAMVFLSNLWLKNRFITYGSIGMIVLILLAQMDFGKTKVSEDLKVLHMTEGLNGQLIVAEKKLNDTVIERTLYINRMGQTMVQIINNAQIKSLWSYPAILKSLASLDGRVKKDALVLGLGGGIVPLFLYDKINLNYTIDAVELDQKIVELAKDYFYLPPQINVIHDDARRYLNSNKKLYDLIVMDVFNGEIAPSHVLSSECFEKVKNSLSKRGVLLINFNGNISGDEGKSGRSLYKTLIEADFKVSILPTLEEGERNRNNIFIASLHSIDFNSISIPIDYIKDDSLMIYDISENLLKLNEIDFSDALTISDDFPIMEQLNQKAAKQWREDYLSNTTLKYRELGIPLVK